MQLRICHKMIIGISIPALIAIFGGILTFGYINDIQNRQGFVQIVDDLKERVLEVRRNEKNFLHYKNTESLDNLHHAILTFTYSMNDISPKTAEAIGEDDFSMLRKLMEAYPILVDNLYENYQQEIKVIEKVRAEGRKLETFVAKGKHAKEITTSFILHLRLLEKNYMLFRDKKSFSQLNTRLGQLRNITPFCLECTPYVDAIHNLFATYSKSDILVNELHAIGDKLENNTSFIARLEREKISSFLQQTKRLLLVALALLCTLGPLLVYKTATYIAAPIKRLAEITRKISEGDITLRAPLKEQDETYSLALSFNTMLDNLQKTQHSLQESLELVHEKQALLVEAEKLASIGTLATGVAHEINNPLNNIYLAAQILGKKIDQESSSKIVKETIKDIFSQTLRVKRIVSELLEFAREKLPDVKEINIVSVVKDVLKQMTVSGELSNIKLDLKSPEEIDIQGDRQLLEQVFINLFNNAIDAMENDGLLDIKINAINTSVQIRISDTGEGILPENIPKVYDPFFTTKEKGTGLGMAIVYGIIRKHKGEIEISSEPNKGTTFTITLPRRG